MSVVNVLNQIPVKAIIYVAIVAVGLALLRGLYEHGVGVGYAEAEAKYQTIIVGREKAAQAVLRASYEALRAREKEYNDRINQLTETHRGRIREIEHAKTVAIANAYTHGLYVDGVCGGSKGTMPDPAASPGGVNGAGRVRLSDQAASFLIGLASQCDVVATRLTSCQKVVLEDRK